MGQIKQLNDPRVRQLAQTLRQNGLAASESEAIRMATSMTSTEQKVSQHYEKHKDDAVMKTRFSPVPPKEQPAPTREKEVVAQQQPSPAEKTAPLHDNDAIAAAISTVKQTYSEPQADIGIDTNQSVNQAAGQEPVAAEIQEPVVAQPAVQEPVQRQSVVSEQPVVQQPVQDQQPVNPMQSQQTQEAAPMQPQQPVQQQPMNQPSSVVDRKLDEPPAPPVEEKRKQFAESKIDLSDVFNFSNR